jgi:hypothetical protein
MPSAHKNIWCEVSEGIKCGVTDRREFYQKGIHSCFSWCKVVELKEK